ncbi:MAG: DNA polymerase I [Chloroflexota bacterium]
MSARNDDLLVLIDGHALVHRAFHAIPELTSPSGELVNAVFGFASMLVKVCADLKPRYLEAAFDTPVKTFRHTEYDDYKATRAASPDGLRGQFPRIYELLETLAVPVVRADGFEADDVLGTLARQAVAEGRDVVILTGDTDALQLVGPHVRVLTSRRGFSDTVMYDEQAVRERYALEPSQIADYKALTGDTSDNIPGVPGIGPKGAAKLLQQYGNVGGILAHLDELPEKQRLLFEKYGEQLTKSKWLATIVCDVPVQLDLASAEFRQFDRARVGSLLRELSFRTLIDRFEQLFDGVDGKLGGGNSPQLGLFDTGNAPAPESDDDTESSAPSIARDLESIRELVSRAQGSASLVIDLRLDGKHPTRSSIVGLCIAISPTDVTYVPIGHTDAGSTHARDCLDALRPLLEADTPLKVMHDAKPAMEALRAAGIELRGLAFDTMIAAFLLESGQRSVDLGALAFSKLQAQLPTLTSLLGTGRSARKLSEVSPTEAATHCCLEAGVIARLEPALRGELERDGLAALFQDIELPLEGVLARMETAGVAINVPALKEMSRTLHQRLGELETAIEQAVGHAFNFNSPQQLSQVLYDELKLPGGKKTKSGHGSTDAGVLEGLRGAHPVIELILEHRQLGKLKSTYVDALPALCDPATGRVHTTFNQTGSRTGRLSSSEPNLQNIPIRTELGRQVRRTFVTESADRVLLSADYSQIELRVLAHVTRDARLVEAFENNEDIHAATAAEVLGIEPSEVTGDQRRLAKAVNFGVLYGMGGFGLAQQTGLPRDDAMRFIERYFTEFGTVKAYQEQVIHETTERGYGMTLVGRRRYFPEIKSPIRHIQMAAQREAINMPIQGTSADIIKIAMVRLDRHLQDHPNDGVMVLQVHDELVFEVPRERLEPFAPIVVSLMEGAMELVVPVRVELKYGENWDEMRPWQIG